VVRSIDQAVSYFAKKAGTHEVNLIGYSGGAAIAVLIAARRHDIHSLRTVAGSLDPAAVNASHGLRPLEGSLNPIDYAAQLGKIPMRHFIGTEDKIIPSSVAGAFADRAGDRTHQSVTEVKGATHSEGWSERWRELLEKPPFPAANPSH
jgi:dienelactone hydrolase